MKVEIVKNDGDNIWGPVDDFSHAQKVKDWILDERWFQSDFVTYTDPEDYSDKIFLARLALKMTMWEHAYAAYLSVKQGPFRQEPQVLTNVDPMAMTKGGYDGIYFYFIFKEDNNGNTYIIKGTP